MVTVLPHATANARPLYTVVILSAAAACIARTCKRHLRPSTFDLNTCVASRNTSLADGCRWCCALARSSCCCCCACSGSCSCCCCAALLPARLELPLAWWPSAVGIVALASAAPAAVTAAAAPGAPVTGACASWAPVPPPAWLAGSGFTACTAPCSAASCCASGPRLTMPCPGSAVLGRTCTSGWEVRSPAARDSRGNNSSGSICSRAAQLALLKAESHARMHGLQKATQFKHLRLAVEPTGCMHLPPLT